MRILFLGLLFLFWTTDLNTQKLGKLKSKVKTRTQTSKPRTVAPPTSQGTNRTSTGSSSTRSNTQYIPIAPPPQQSTSSRSSSRGKLGRLKDRVKERIEREKNYQPPSGGNHSSGGHVTYYTPLLPGGYYFYNDYYSRYPYFYYQRNNWMMDHYYGSGSRYYSDRYTNQYADDEYEDEEFYGNEEQLYGDYPFASQRFYRSTSGERKMLNVFGNRGYNSTDKTLVETYHFFMAFEMLSLNANYTHLEEDVNNVKTTLHFTRFGPGYFHTFTEYDASINMHIGLASAELADASERLEFDGWNYGVELKAFLPANVSVNASYTFYGLSHSYDGGEADFNVRMFDFNLAYHIYRFEFIGGMKYQKFVTDNFSFRQPYFGIGFYL